MTVASFFRKYSVGCILNYVRRIITREISCIYIYSYSCSSALRSVACHNTTYNENVKLTSDAQLLDFSLPCRAANDFR
jgi:Na+-translocating ferredoxin:NAD+ oxidoreductase RnfD subunit